MRVLQSILIGLAFLISAVLTVVMFAVFWNWSEATMDVGLLSDAPPQVWNLPGWCYVATIVMVIPSGFLATVIIRRRRANHPTTKHVAILTTFVTIQLAAQWFAIQQLKIVEWVPDSDGRTLFDPDYRMQNACTIWMIWPVIVLILESLLSCFVWLTRKLRHTHNSGNESIVDHCVTFRNCAVAALATVILLVVSEPHITEMILDQKYELVNKELSSVRRLKDAGEYQAAIAQIEKAIKILDNERGRAGLLRQSLIDQKEEIVTDIAEEYAEAAGE